jgi:putative oxidoreductase
MPIFSTSISVLYANLCLLLVRLSVSTIILVAHGLPKLNRLTSGEEIKFADPFGIGPQISLGLAVFAEVVCSIFIILGLGTRLAAIPLAITMAMAAFFAHANDPFATKEKPIAFMLVFIMLLVFGSGRYSIDRLVTKTNLQ